MNNAVNEGKKQTKDGICGEGLETKQRVQFVSCPMSVVSPCVPEWFCTAVCRRRRCPEMNSAS